MMWGWGDNINRVRGLGDRSPIYGPRGRGRSQRDHKVTAETFPPSTRRSGRRQDKRSVTAANIFLRDFLSTRHRVFCLPSLTPPRSQKQNGPFGLFCELLIPATLVLFLVARALPACASLSLNIFRRACLHCFRSTRAISSAGHVICAFLPAS